MNISFSDRTPEGQGFKAFSWPSSKRVSKSVVWEHFFAVFCLSFKESVLFRPSGEAFRVFEMHVQALASHA